MTTICFEEYTHLNDFVISCNRTVACARNKKMNKVNRKYRKLIHLEFICPFNRLSLVFSYDNFLNLFNRSFRSNLFHTDHQSYLSAPKNTIFWYNKVPTLKRLKLHTVYVW